MATFSVEVGGCYLTENVFEKDGVVVRVVKSRHEDRFMPGMWHKIEALGHFGEWVDLNLWVPEHKFVAPMSGEGLPE